MDPLRVEMMCGVVVEAVRFLLLGGALFSASIGNGLSIGKEGS
jgi:hypothetical protein